MNVAELLILPALALPDQEILRFEGDGLTYGELLERVCQAAGVLRDLGVQAGDRVAVIETNTPEVVVLVYATAMRGATFVPLNYRARADELAQMLGLAAPRVLFVGERYADIGAESLAQTPNLDFAPTPLAALAKPTTPESPEAELDDTGLAVLLFTSGTTARAKAVMLDHADLTDYVMGTVEMASGEDVGTAALAAPIYHVAGLTSLLRATFMGRRMVLMRQFEAAEWLRLVESEHVTHAFLVPTMLKRVLDLPNLAHADLSQLQAISYGAAPMPLGVIRRAIETLPPHIGYTNAFGQTETTATVTILGPEDHRLAGTPDEVEARVRRLASVGRPIADVQIRIVDGDGNQLGVGEIGELAIRSERLMRGYYGDAEATAATLKDGWLLTRDLGWVDEQGYVFLAGRKSDMIIRGGENVAPEEVEVVLAAHPGVEEVGVFGIPDLDWGEVIAAAVVPRAGSTLTEAELIEFCRQRLASFKKPDRVVFVTELPRNPLGKLLRRELRLDFGDPPAQST